MIDLPPIIEPPAIIVPAKKRSGSRPDRTSQPSTRPTPTAPALAIGAIIVLSDGTPCEVYHIDGDRFWCWPLD